MLFSIQLLRLVYLYKKSNAADIMSKSLLELDHPPLEHLSSGSALCEIDQLLKNRIEIEVVATNGSKPSCALTLVLRVTEEPD